MTAILLGKGSFDKVKDMSRIADGLISDLDQTDDILIHNLEDEDPEAAKGNQCLLKNL